MKQSNSPTREHCVGLVALAALMLAAPAVNGQVAPTAPTGGSALFIDAEGRVGIGNQAPQSALHVNGTIRGVGIVPPGTILPYGGDTSNAEVVQQLEADGWLVCDGSGVPLGRYQELYKVIGTAYGATYSNDGQVTEFRLPDLRGRFLRGVDQGQGRDPKAGQRTASAGGGNKGDRVGSLQDDQFKSHTHQGSHLGTRENAIAGGSYWGHAPYNTKASGGDETRPKNLYVNFIIKAGQISR